MPPKSTKETSTSTIGSKRTLSQDNGPQSSTPPAHSANTMFHHEPTIMRSVVFATLACPLFIGTAFMIYGGYVHYPHKFRPHESVPPLPDWLFFCSSLVLTIISLRSLSRFQKSEFAFRWLFFFGLFCFVLSLLELRSEWRVIQAQSKSISGILPNRFYDVHAPIRIIPILVTVLLGLGHTIAAVVLDYIHAIRRPTLRDNLTYSQLLSNSRTE